MLFFYLIHNIVLYLSSSNTVTYFNATTGAYLNGNLANSSFTTGSSPMRVAVNPTLNIVYTPNQGSNTVTFFNATTGAYLNGNIGNSSFITDTAPFGVAVTQ